MPILFIVAMHAAQVGVGSSTIELRGRIRESYVASELTVEANGIVSKCQPAPRPFDNVSRPDDICSAYPAGTRYSNPTTFKGKPQRRKVRVRITTYEENIGG